MSSPTCGNLIDALKQKVVTTEVLDFFLDWEKTRPGTSLLDYRSNPLTEHAALEFAHEVAAYFCGQLNNCIALSEGASLMHSAIRLIIAVNIESIKLGVAFLEVDYFGGEDTPIERLMSISESPEGVGRIDKRTAAALVEMFLHREQTPAPLNQIRPDYFSSN